MVSQWFNFSLGFANDGCDGDTVRHILSVLSGLTINIRATGLRDNTEAVLPVSGVDEVNLDVVVDTFDQVDDGSLDYPVYLVGWTYDESQQHNDFRGAPVRIPLANSRITVY